MSADNVSEDVDRFVAGLEPDESSQRKRKRATKAVAALPAEMPRDDVAERVERDDVRGDEDEDIDSGPQLPRDLPRPTDTARSLDGVMAKFGIGENPDFKVQLHRLLPKYFPGGVQAYGFMEEFTIPLSESYINAEYGGGTYEVRVLGPDPTKSANAVRRYDSIKVEISGAANPSRLARSVQAKLDASSGAPAVGAPATGASMVMQAPAENPTVAAQALKIVADAAERERDARVRAEDKASDASARARELMDPLVDAANRRADELVKAERERSKTEREALEQRLRESRDDLRRLEQKVETMNATPQPSFAEQLKDVIPLLGSGDKAAASAAHTAETITQSIITRHSDEIASLHKQHQSMLDSMRSSHASEIASLRDAGMRELEAERQAGRNREQRHEEQLKTEREERRRDTEMYKKDADARDKQWRDRMEQQEINLKTQWESRVETQKTNFESQLQWMRSELEQSQLRVRTFESKTAEQGDLVAQLGRLKDVRSVAKDMLGFDDSPPAPAGGIGLQPSGLAGLPSEWAGAFETAIENFPAIWATIQNRAPSPPQGEQQQQQAQAQQQAQLQPGQIVNTQQGVMVVINTRDGLRLTPKADYDAYVAQQQEGQRTSRQVSAGPKQRGMLAKPPQKRPSDGIPVPNMAEGLPLKPRQWGEAVQPPMPDAGPVQQAQATDLAPPSPQAPRQQRRRDRPTADIQQQVGMDKTQVMIANEVAKLVHQSVDNAEEPEEFVKTMLSGGYPDVVIRGIADMSDEQVIASIKHVQPTSAGTTPLGQRFIREAMAVLRASI